jgi:hypothetical protein
MPADAIRTAISPRGCGRCGVGQRARRRGRRPGARRPPRRCSAPAGRGRRRARQSRGHLSGRMVERGVWVAAQPAGVGPWAGRWRAQQAGSGCGDGRERLGPFWLDNVTPPGGWVGWPSTPPGGVLPRVGGGRLPGGCGATGDRAGEVRRGTPRAIHKLAGSPRTLSATGARTPRRAPRAPRAVPPHPRPVTARPPGRT